MSDSVTFNNIPDADLKDQIDSEGVVFRIEKMADYLNQKQFISAGKLHDIISKTPRQFLYLWHEPEKETDALRLGSAFHTAILEPDEFPKRYDVMRKSNLPYPDKDFRTKENREYRDTFNTGCEMRGTTLLTEEEDETIRMMQDALKNNETTANILRQQGVIELSVYTKITWNGREFYVKIRPDKISKQKPYFLDLKKTRSASPEVNKFPKDAVTYGYHIKLAFYRDILDQVWQPFMKFSGITEPKLLRSLIIAVEDSPPFDLLVYNVPGEVIELGRYVYNQALSRFAEAIDSQQWKGYSIYSEEGNSIVDLILPAWANKEIVV